jgi:hypothetical protein
MVSISAPVSLARRHVLGDLYSRCEGIETIPVYLDTVEGEVLGHVDQSLGHDADAFSFHLPDDVCKKLSSGFFTYAFDYEYAEKKGPKHLRRLQLNSICLIARQNYERPIARSTRQSN